MLKLKLQKFGHLMQSWLAGKDPDAGKDWGQEEKGLTEDEMVGWHHWLNRHESEQTLEDSEGEGSLACCSPWGRIESNMTEQLNSRLPSQLMLTAINVWFLTKEIHSLPLMISSSSKSASLAMKSSLLPVLSTPTKSRCSTESHTKRKIKQSHWPCLCD